MKAKAFVSFVPFYDNIFASTENLPFLADPKHFARIIEIMTRQTRKVSLWSFVVLQ